MKAYRNEFKLNDEKLVVVTINQEEEAKKIVKKVIDRIHHVFLLDRSGSMWGSINQLMDQVQDCINFIRNDDLISIAWFSSMGEYKVVVKGAKKDNDLIALINSMRSALNLTCFSEVIQEAGSIISDLSGVCKNASVTLFTDGQPVVPISMEEEIRRSMTAVANMKNKIIAFNTIGYGNYCNEKFLHDLAKISSFGAFAHADNIESFGKFFRHNFSKIEKTVVESVDISTPNNDTDILYLTRKSTKMGTGVMSVDFLDSDKNQFFIVGKGDFKFEYNGKVFDSSDIKETVSDPTMVNFFYTWAYNNLIEGKKAYAVDILGKKTFDKHLIDVCNAAFNKSERENARALLEEAVFSNSARWVEGKCPNNYLPNPKAHCVMDILYELSSSFGYFLPYHEDAEDYNRIGRKREDLDKKFKRSPGTVLGDMSDLVYNQKRANISIKVPITGHVSLSSEDSLKVGATSIECIEFKTYNLIRDGNLNMSSMVIVAPEYVMHSLESKGCICKPLGTKVDKETLNALKEKHGYKFVGFLLDLKNKPIINRMYLLNASDLSVIAKNETNILELEAMQKVVNYYIGEVYAKNKNAEKEGLFKKLKQEAIEVCKSYGITSEGWYHPVSTQEVKSGDVITFRELDFCFKGCSQLPSMKDLLAGKKVDTVTGKLMLDKAKKLKETVTGLGVDLEDKSFKVRDVLNGVLADVKKELNSERHFSTTIKLAKVLNGDWFQGLKVDAKGNEYFETNSGETLYLKNTYKTEVL